MIKSKRKPVAPAKPQRSPAVGGSVVQPDAARRIQILNEAATLFRERGFEVTSMREIANRVGVSKPALYHWFPKKDDILIGIILEALEQLCLRTERAIARSTVPEEQIEFFFQAHIAYIDSNPTFYGAAYAAFAALPKSPARDIAVKWRDRHEQNLRNILAAGLDSGEFSDLDVNLTSRAILSALAAVTRWYSPRGELTAAEIALEYSRLFLGGMRNRNKKKKPRRQPVSSVRAVG